MSVMKPGMPKKILLVHKTYFLAKWVILGKPHFSNKRGEHQNHRRAPIFTSGLIDEWASSKTWVQFKS